MAAEVFEGYEGIIMLLLCEGHTYEEVSTYITGQTGHRRGLSQPSLIL